MSTILHRLGSWCALRRGRVILTWLLLLAAVAVGAATLSEPTDDGFSIPGTEAQRAIDLLDEKFPGTGGASARVVVAAPEGKTLDEARYAQLTSAALAKVAMAPQVIAVSASVDGTVSEDGRIGFADVQYAVPVDEIDEESKEALDEIAEPLRDAGMQVEFSGGVIATSAQHGASAELMGMLIGFFVLSVTFGALVAAGMPLVMALIGVGIGLLGIQTLTGFVELSSTAPSLALMLGLAVGIDYALFIVSRHRSQLAAGMPMQESIAMATATAGGAVVFAGLTVVIALAALTVTGIPFLTAMGLAAAATVVITVLISITLVPASLALLGTRLDKGRLPLVAGNRTPNHRPLAGPMAEKWGRLVVAHPLISIGAVIALCALVASPLLAMNLGLPDDSSKSTDTTERRAYDLLTEGFGPGFNGPLTLVISAPEEKNAAEVGAAAGEGLSQLRNVAAVTPAIPNETGDVAILVVTPASAPSSEATRDLVQDIRDAAADVVASTDTESRAYVTGTTAVNIDVSAKLADKLPLFLSVIVLLAFVLLMLVFRSILVPIKAVVGFLLSIGASLGAVVFVFQQGHFADLLGVETQGPVLSFLPVLLIGILFGLAMDYEVFLVSRIREDYLHTGDAQRAITSGMRDSGRVVTAAALIMLAVFGSFILAHDPVLKSIGFALTLGVLVDAFLVRMTLVPAVLALLGKSAWRLPAWLDRRLPDLDIEGTKLAHAPQGQAR